MSSKKWLLGACGGVVASLLAVNTASASLEIDLRVVSVTGSGTVNGNTVMNPAVGDVVNIGIFADVRGANTTSTNDGFQSLQGSLKMTGSTSDIKGTITPTGDALNFDNDGNPLPGPALFGVGLFTLPTAFNNSFADNGTTNGTAQDLNPKDGNIDYGGEPTDSTGIGDFMAIRSATMQTTGGTTLPADAKGSDNGREYQIGSFSVTITNANGTDTSINFYPRLLTNGSTAQSSALWQEDVKNTGAKDASSGTLLVGAPVVLQAVPEPGTLSLLGLGALGLLGRRNRRN